MLYVQGGSCHLYTVIYNHFLNIKYTEYSRLEVKSTSFAIHINQK